MRFKTYLCMFFGLLLLCSVVFFCVSGEEQNECAAHTFETVADVPATCSSDGYQRRVCSVCGYDFTEILPAVSHNWEITATAPATCCVEGTVTYSCSACGAIKYEALAKLEHTRETMKDTKPNCTDNGSQGGVHCRVCQEILESPVILPANGHRYMSAVIAPTPSKQGYTIHVCSVCSYSYKDTFTDYGSPTADPSSPATASPSPRPTRTPRPTPTAAPTRTPAPTVEPMEDPTENPDPTGTGKPTRAPATRPPIQTPTRRIPVTPTPSPVPTSSGPDRLSPEYLVDGLLVWDEEQIYQYFGAIHAEISPDVAIPDDVPVFAEDTLPKTGEYYYLIQEYDRELPWYYNIDEYTFYRTLYIRAVEDMETYDYETRTLSISMEYIQHLYDLREYYRSIDEPYVDMIAFSNGNSTVEIPMSVFESEPMQRLLERLEGLMVGFNIELNPNYYDEDNRYGSYLTISIQMIEGQSIDVTSLCEGATLQMYMISYPITISGFYEQPLISV